ncbi:MAG: hypothetical protein CM1200mP40_28770 [Gammaproteobacteria bacterium]|nr:MAG: hypothetical protein CM1200mP40_28770 [Gammaproteobacteria bacterium]
MSLPYVLVLYYSRSGATEKKGATDRPWSRRKFPGVEARVRTVPPVSPDTEATEPIVPESGANFLR